MMITRRLAWLIIKTPELIQLIALSNDSVKVAHLVHTNLVPRVSLLPEKKRDPGNEVESIL